MRVYLVQHGEAVAKDVDPARPLSDKGKSDVQGVAAFLSAAGIRVERVVHSGKTRAKQTAELFAGKLSPGGVVEAMEGLNPKDSAEQLAEVMASMSADLLVAGHQPFMGAFASRLLTGQADVLAIAYRPGSVVCLERDEEGRWALQWMVRPELLGE